MKKILFALLFNLLILSFLYSQHDLSTVAESTNYQNTSSYNDVINFINRLDKSYKQVRIETIAITEEGRAIPMMVVADPMPKSAVDLKNDSRIVVYMQGNIHAGEVEGKEALQMFVRDLLLIKNNPVFKDVVFLICPVFNADGNEKFSTQNRMNQNGPKNGVGVRYNGAYLDLNRDALKMESPEVKGLITNVFNKWDPSLFMDIHTTNGVFRQQPLTFGWMMNPNGNRNLINYMRDKMMPQVGKQLMDKYKVDNCFFGEFEDPVNPDKYLSYAHEPRYIVNYAGLRNRLSILNENYVYADFKTRVESTYSLIKTVVEYMVEHKNEIKKQLHDADNRSVNRWSPTQPVDSFSFDYRVMPTPEKVTVKLYEAEKIPNAKSYPGYRQTSVKQTLTIPYYADYFPNRSIAYPYAYVLNISDKRVLDNLKSHGIKLEKLTADQTLKAERFAIDSLKPSDRLNQGHYTNTIFGKFVKDTIEFKSGTYVVRTNQKLAGVAAYLLEPQSGDGLLFWNYFDNYLVPQWGSGFYPYPVYRVCEKTEMKLEGDN